MITLFYQPVQFVGYTPTYPEDLRKTTPYHLSPTRDRTFVNILYSCLQKQNKRAAFNKSEVRLIVEPFDGHPVFMMDSQGNVQCGSRAYQITPRAFLDIFTLMLNVMDQTEKQKKS